MAMRSRQLQACRVAIAGRQCAASGVDLVRGGRGLRFVWVYQVFLARLALSVGGHHIELKGLGK